jgi:hypothetical protein
VSGQRTWTNPSKYDELVELDQEKKGRKLMGEAAFEKVKSIS